MVKYKLNISQQIYLEKDKQTIHVFFSMFAFRGEKTPASHTLRFLFGIYMQRQTTTSFKSGKKISTQEFLCFLPQLE